MIMSKIEQVFREHFDYNDRDTRRMIIEASDANQNQIMVALTSKLYEMIVAKVANIDYTTISSSRGDITKIENYADLAETINIIKRLVSEYRCDPSPVVSVEQAIENVKSRTADFKKAFVIGSPVPITLYNNTCMCIVSSVSFLIDTTIEYIKNPQSQSFQMALDVVAYNKTRDNLMFESLATFNEGCRTGDVDNAVKLCLSKTRVHKEAVEMDDVADVKPDSPFLSDEEINDPSVSVIHDKCSKKPVEEGFDGIASIVARALIALCKLVIPLIRQLVYMYFYSRQRVSDYFESNATLIEMNAYQLQFNQEMDPDRRQEIYNKQMKIAERLRKKAQRTSIDYQRSKKDAEKEMTKDQKKLTEKDIDYNPNDENLDNAMQSSVLF